MSSRSWCIALFAFLMTWLAPAHAQLDLAALPFVTRHSGTFNGQRIDYVATVAKTVVPERGAGPGATFVSTSYVREGAEPDKRPVLFLFNGGPSASSATLHMVGLGPKRIVVTQDPAQPAPAPARVVDNTETVLDVADLVFVDPAETGFSRIAPNASREYYYSANGDAESVAKFVETWCRDNKRERSPKFVLGESYGTIRAAIMAGQLAKALPLDGLYLFGQAVNIVETTQRAKNAVGYATNLPALAAVAVYHGKASRGRKTMAAFIDEVYSWAVTEYLDALVTGRDLPARNRERIAQRLQDFTGIDSEYYLAHDLVISKVEFARALLKEQGLIVAAYDARYAGPAPKSGERPVDPFAKVQAATMPMVRAHLAERLGVTLPMNEYREGAPNAAQGWHYNPTGGAGGPFWDYDYQAAISNAFAANPRFRLMIGTGIYDLTTTVGPARYLITKSDYPADRVFLRQYEGGHMAYTNEPALKAFTADIRAFVTGAAPKESP